MPVLLPACQFWSSPRERKLRLVPPRIITDTAWHAQGLDDPLHWEHMPKIYPKRVRGGGGGNPELGLAMDAAVYMGREERLEVRGVNGAH